jgi:hypothetical protein
VDAVDDTAALAIEEMVEKSVSLGKHFYVCGATASVMTMFSGLGMVDKMLLRPDTPRRAALEAAVA